MNKCREVWDYLESYDIIGLTETWAKESTWKRIKGKLSQKFNWWYIQSMRESKQGRAKEGILMAAHRRVKVNEFKEWDKRIGELRATIMGRSWRILTIYSQNMDESLKMISERIEEREKESLILGGDFNARVREEVEHFTEMLTEEKTKRRSKYKKVNIKGRKLIEGLRERGWIITNGCFGKDREWIYVRDNGDSVIDYIIANENLFEDIIEVTEGERIESDHVPLQVLVKGTDVTEDKVNRREEKFKEIRRSD